MTTPTQPDKNQPQPRPPRMRGGAAQAAQAWSVAMNFVYGVIAMGLIGWALERWVWPQAAPWLIIGGCILGLVAGMVRLIHEANQMYRK